MTAYERFTLAVAVLAAVISAVAMVVSAVTALRIHKDQMLLSRRQLFLEIWPKIASISSINALEPIEKDVIDAVNVLELVALCEEGEMVDADVIRRSFGERYLHLHKQVEAVTAKLKSCQRTGPELLLENPAIGKLYKTLETEQQDAGAIPRKPKSKSKR